MSLKNNQSNPVMEVYRGRDVRKYNTLRIRVNQFEFKKFIDAKLDNGFSERELIEHTCKPCNQCKGVHVVVFNRNDEVVKIERGLLCKKR